MQQELPQQSVSSLSQVVLCVRARWLLSELSYGAQSQASLGSFPPSIQSFLVALKVKRKKRERQTAVVHKKEQSRGTRGKCSLVLFFIGEAGFQESEDDGEEEQDLVIEQVGQCSCP